MTRNNFLAIASFFLVVVAGSVVGFQYLLVHLSLYPNSLLPVPFAEILLFIAIASLLTLSFVYWRFKKDATAAGRSYFSTVFFKIFGSAFLLYPNVWVNAEQTKPTAAVFLSIFFLFLLVETILLVKLLNMPLDEKKKNDENQ